MVATPESQEKKAKAAAAASREEMEMGRGSSSNGNGKETTRDEDEQYKGGVTGYVLLTCAVAATGGLIFGYDIGVSGGVSSMHHFLAKFFPDVAAKAERAKQTNYCKYDNEKLTAFTSSLYLAALFSSMAASTVTKSLGRKASMLAGGLTFLVGAIMDGLAQNLLMLIVGRLLLGLGVGFADQAVPIYLSEMAPPRWRGAFNIGFQIFLGVGVLLSGVINYFTAKLLGHWGWRLSLGLAAVPAVVMVVGTLPLPDTPAGLLQRGRRDEAQALLRRLRGVHDVGQELRDMDAALALAQAQAQAQAPAHKNANALRTVLTSRRYRPQLIVALAIQVFSQTTGINIIAFYGPVIFSTVGFGSDAALMSAVILGVVSLLSTCVSVAVVDRFGRKRLLLISCAQIICCQIAIAAILATKLAGDGGGVMSKGWAIVLVLFMCLFVVGFGWSWGPLSWLLATEIFPLEVRSAGTSVAVAVQLLVTFILAQFFLSMLCHMEYGVFLFYAGLVAISAVFVYLFVPETKGCPINNISSLFQKHWFWKRILCDVGDHHLDEEKEVVNAS